MLVKSYEVYVQDWCFMVSKSDLINHSQEIDFLSNRNRQFFDFLQKKFMLNSMEDLVIFLEQHQDTPIFQDIISAYRLLQNNHIDLDTDLLSFFKQEYNLSSEYDVVVFLSKDENVHNIVSYIEGNDYIPVTRTH